MSESDKKLLAEIAHIEREGLHFSSQEGEKVKKILAARKAAC